VLSVLGLALVLLGSTPAAPRAQPQQEPTATTEPSGAVGTAQVLVVPIQGTIDVRSVYLVGTALREARANGIRHVVLDLDTPGGPIESTKELETLLGSLSENDVHVVAFVRHHALSAGAYVALACHEIFMAPGSSIGAITPVVLGPDGIQQIPDDDARRKIISAVRADVRALVERRQQLPAGLAKAAEAMVDPSLEVFEVTYEDSAGVQQSTILEAAEVEALEQQGSKVLRRTPLGRSPLTFTAAEAERLRFSSGTYGSIEELAREEFLLPPESIFVMEERWSEDAVAWLDSMKPVLFVLGFLLLLIELKTPGFAVPGVLGIALLGLAMFSSYLVGLAEWTEIILFFLGVGLVAVEIFVMPGTLIFGLGGLICVIAGLVLSQQSFLIPANDTQRDILLGNLTNVLLLTVCVIVAAALVWRFLPYIPVFNKVLQPPPETPATGASTRFGAAGEQGAAPASALVGKIGLAITDLRPVGAMELEGGDRHDALALGMFVTKGTRVRVIGVQGNQILVEPVAEGERGEVGIGLLIMLWLLGLCFAIAEVFFPSFGVLSALSALAFVSSIFLAYTQHSAATGHVFLVTASIAIPAALYWAFKVLPKTPFGKAMLQPAPERSYVQRAAEQPDLDRFLHRTGHALSTLRPSGSARIGDDRVDVITRGEMLEKGTRIRVIQVEGNRVVVKQDDDGVASGSPS
jgi:membrane-bound serine protease (ClpP class)